jgi:hypothetical protein
LVELAEKEGVAERVADLYIRDLEERGVIHREGRSFRGGEQLILDYEQDVDREAFYAANEARRELLDAAGTALGEGRTLKYRRNSAENYTLRPWHEARGAAFMLQATGLGTLRETMGGNFDFELTARGYELAQDSSALSATFPTSRDEDIELSGSPSGPPAGETRVAGHGLDGRERDGGARVSSLATRIATKLSC